MQITCWAETLGPREDILVKLFIAYMYFDRVTAFKLLYLGTAVKGGRCHTCSVEALHDDASAATCT